MPKKLPARVGLVVFASLAAFLAWGQWSDISRYSSFEFTLSSNVAYPLAVPGILIEDLMIQALGNEAHRTWMHPSVAVLCAALFWSVGAYVAVALIQRIRDARNG